VANTEFPGVPYSVTVSVGAAEFPANGITRDDIVGAADAALYDAKGAGRNQVCLASSTPASAGNE
jgi:GGDEF domain-containing protein